MFFESLPVCLKVWLMQFAYKVSKCCSRIFDMWSNFALGIFQKAKKSDKGCPRTVPPRGSEKQVAKSNAPPGESANLPNRSQHLKVWRIMSSIVRCSSTLFFGCFQNGCFDRFGINFSIIVMICLDFLEYHVKTCRLA